MTTFYEDINYGELRLDGAMITKVCEGLIAFIWQNYQENNCNTYLIDTDMRILIDPGHRHLFDHVLRGLNALGIQLTGIDVVLITHAHPDHLEGISLFKKPTLFTMGLDDYRLMKDLAGPSLQMPEPDFFLREGDLKLGSRHFQVIASPGHSPGSVCIYWPDKKALFTGDVAFFQGIGRTDLPGGDGALLKESIRRIAALDVEYLLTGHGNVVAGKDKVEANFRMIEDYWFDYL